MIKDVTLSRREVNRALLATAFGLLSGGLASGGRGLTGAPALVARPLFAFAIAGGYYYGLRAVKASLQPGTALRLRREPENPYDADAIAVDIPDGPMLGYVPRRANTPVARLLDAGGDVRAEVIGPLTSRRDEEIPPDLVFTSFMSGDPKIALSAVFPAA